MFLDGSIQIQGWITRATKEVIRYLQHTDYFMFAYSNMLIFHFLDIAPDFSGSPDDIC